MFFFYFSPVIMRSFLSESNELKWMEWMRFSKIRRSSSWPKSGSRPSCELGNLATANLSGAPSLHPSTNYANIRKYTQIYAQIYTNVNVSSEGAAANLSGAPFSLSPATNYANIHREPFILTLLRYYTHVAQSSFSTQAYIESWFL